MTTTNGHVALPAGDVHYWESGEGPTLVQIHGSGLAHWNFSKVTPLLNERLRVIDFDMPGYGQSGPPSKSLGFVDLADDVAAFLRAFSDRPVHVHGSSFGGVVALALAGRHPDVVDRLVVSVALPRSDKAALHRRQMWAKVAALEDVRLYTDVTMESGFSRAFFERPDAEEIMEEVRQAMITGAPGLSTYIEGTISMIDHDVMEFVDNITAETLLLAGSEDLMTPHEPEASGIGLARVRDVIPGARMEVIEGAGHYILLEQPQQVAGHILDFLTEPRAA